MKIKIKIDGTEYTLRSLYPELTSDPNVNLFDHRYYGGVKVPLPRLRGVIECDHDVMVEPNTRLVKDGILVIDNHPVLGPINVECRMFLTNTTVEINNYDVE